MKKDKTKQPVPAAPEAPKAADKPVQAPEAAPKPAPVPAAPEAPKEYVCVLAVKEDNYKAKAGDKYKGAGLKDFVRLEHLLKRGAIKAV